ncbi:hypothetical protein [Pseudomonas yamanorum]|uniref:Uncharacterized protein n=1 Tax=Pseudomonas yamanorum TaxID=515393 RepID=A0A7Y8K6E5_9PSED|nr:hypothetical protein [Pseudomonas yamanorum]NWE77802.1 hypothetical protein [Pseudomonas yamanorum]
MPRFEYNGKAVLVTCVWGRAGDWFAICLAYRCFHVNINARDSRQFHTGDTQLDIQFLKSVTTFPADHLSHAFLAMMVLRNSSYLTSAVSSAALMPTLRFPFCGDSFVSASFLNPYDPERRETPCPEVRNGLCQQEI